VNASVRRAREVRPAAQRLTVRGKGESWKWVAVELELRTFRGGEDGEEVERVLE
jgi:hypothetical protein